MSQPTTTVFYNSACPVCDAGIATQKTRMTTCNVQWVDVHTNPAATEPLGASVDQVRERLYVRDAAGHIHIGADAMSALLVMTPTQRWLGHFSRWPGVRQLANISYNIFAKYLYRWNVRHKHW